MSPRLDTLLVLLGATASGKTQAALEIAQMLGCEIVSADSRQIFRELIIGSAAPSQQELQCVPHHLVQCHSVRERYSAGQYELEALSVIERLLQRDHVALLTGGSMLYVDAVCQGLDQFPPPDMDLRERLSEQLRTQGVESLCDMLSVLDPQSWTKVDRRNGARVLRALEVTLQTGRPYSEFLRSEKAVRPFRIVKIGIHRDWPSLDERIVRRTQQMVADGLVEEVASLAQYRALPSLKTVGYREIFRHLDGECSLPEAITDIITHTRRYAKKQMTWWRRDPQIEWVEGQDLQRLTTIARDSLNQ